MLKISIILFRVIRFKDIRAKLPYINIDIRDIITYITCYICNSRDKELSEIF
jgi:hypothetical protein